MMWPWVGRQIQSVTAGGTNCTEWSDMVKPIVKKVRLSVTLDMNTTFSPDGSQALADLLEKMAAELDLRS